ADAAVRSAEYFNSHPYLAGLALGALVRAEYEHVPGAQISRLRTALCSPLGSLGDQLFWAGVVPAVIGGVLWAPALWPAGKALVAGVIGSNLLRLATSWWALRTGLASGMQVGAAINDSWLPRAAGWAGLAAGLVIGLALPLVGSWLLQGLGRRGVLLAGVTM